MKSCRLFPQIFIMFILLLIGPPLPTAMAITDPTLPPSLLWTITYNGPGNGMDDGYGIAVDGEGNVYVVGDINVGPDYDAWLGKYDKNGNLLWAVTYNGPSNMGDTFGGIALDGIGNVFVVGTTHDSYTGRDILIAKI